MQAEALVILSSSPDFPDIGDLLPAREKKPALRSGSRAAPIPEKALSSFTTASHFWRTAAIEDTRSTDIGEGGGEAESEEKTSKSKTSRPRTSKATVKKDTPLDKGEIDMATAIVLSVAQSQAKQTEDINLQQSEQNPNVKAVGELGLPPKGKTKPRKRVPKEKDQAGGQTTIAKGKITKASTARPKQTRKKAETVSKHFASAAAPEADNIVDDPIDLEPALKRRTDWTPTKNTEQSIIVLDSSTVKDLMSPGPTDVESSLRQRKDIFESLRHTYGCVDAEESARELTPIEQRPDVLGKRKLIELVTTSKAHIQETPVVSPVKQKAPRKKPRTITELATAAYRVIDTAEEQKDESVLDYFPVNDGSKSAETATLEVVTAKAKGSKPGAKPRPKRATKKKAVPPQPILLSPASALRQVRQQDFVFGTSSQLATEVDAGLLRDLQQAMRDSNRQESSTPNRAAGDKSSANRLWGAGARDVDGELLALEVIDLVDSPAIEKDLTNPAVILALAIGLDKRGKESLDLTPAVPIPETEVISISSSLTPTHATEDLSSLQKRPTINGTETVPAAVSSSVRPESLLKHVETTIFDEDPPASNQEQHHQMASSAPEVATPMPRKKRVPNWESFTDASLAKAMKSYGFKPKKSRKASIALLMQCWSSKNERKTEVLGQGTTASMSTSSAAAAKSNPPASPPAAPKPRGRPKKIAATTEPLETASASVLAPAPAEPIKRPRGRPKKDSSTGDSAVTKTTTKATVKAPSKPAPPPETASGPSTPKRRKKTPAPAAIEIADSDQEDPDPSDLSSAPSSPAPANEFSSPAAGVDISMTEADDTALSLTSSPTDQQARLFEYITDAVRTAPRSADPEVPSWHEKMLLYDPVVLEDLTVWLNGGQLDRVGCEEEVAAGDVKKWCESKSVCCLWKVNFSGKERKRF